MEYCTQHPLASESQKRQVTSDLVDGESDAQVLDAHLLLLATVLLHESDETGALSVSVAVLLQIDDELRILHKRGVVTAAPGRALGALPRPTLDHRIPALVCSDARSECKISLPIQSVNLAVIGHPYNVYRITVYLRVRFLQSLALVYFADAFRNSHTYMYG